MAGRLLSKRAAARYLGCSATTLYRLIDEKKIKPVPAGCYERLRLADLEELDRKGWRWKSPKKATKAAP